MSGNRYNKGKPGFNLLPLDALKEICSVYDFGASKYAPWNWAKGLSWSETQASLMRHLADWSIGEDKDQESGLWHDVHIAWNAITLVAMRLRGIGTDDRFKLVPVSDDVSRHTTEGHVRDAVTPVTTTYDPSLVVPANDIPDVVWPYYYDPNTGNGRFTVVDPGSGHVKFRTTTT